MSETDWKSTMSLNAERAVAAGIFWTIVMLIWSPPGQPATESLKWLYQFPIMYLLGLVPLGLIAVKLHESGIEWAGIFTGFVSLLIVVGDPIIYLIKKVLPNFVPVDSMKIFNRVLVLLVKKSA